MSPVRKPAPTPPDPIHVPGHLIPRKCSMCHREIVRVPTKAGIVHVDYPVRMGQGADFGRLYGDTHDCPATRWEPKEKR